MKAIVLTALLALTWSAAGAFPPAGSANIGSSPIVSVTPASYTLPTTASTNVGTGGLVTTTFADGSSVTNAPLSITSGSGSTATDGSSCDSTTTPPHTAPSDFDVSSNTLKTSSGYATQEWDYVCVTSSPAGRTPFTQLIALNRNDATVAHSPQHTQVVAVGDTNTTGTTWQYPTYAQMLSPDYGWTLTTRGTGDTMTACSASLGTIISDATGTINADYRSNPAWLLNFGLYEANTYGAGGGAETAFFDCLAADARWLVVPNANKQLAAAVTSGNKHGAWANYSTTGLSVGTCLQSSDTATPADITFSITPASGVPNSGAFASYPSSNVYVWWGAVSAAGTGNSGLTLTYSLDGGAAQNISPDNYQVGAAVQSLWLHELTRAAHTVKITLPASFGATGVTAIIVCAAGTPPRAWATKVELAGVPKAQSGSPYSAYDLDVAHVAGIVAQNLTDVIYSPTRTYVNTTTDWADATHLSASGQVHMAQAFSENLYKCIYGVSAATLLNPFTSGLTCPTFNEDSSNSVDIYSGLVPTAGKNWHAAGVFPQTATVSTNEWRAAHPSSGGGPPWSHAQLGDACCTLSNTFSGFIDDGSSNDGLGHHTYSGVAGNVLTVTSGNANGGGAISGTGVTAATISGITATGFSNSACGNLTAAYCTVSASQLVPPGTNNITVTYTGQSFSPTVNNAPVVSVPVASSCGTPVGASAGTPPFLVGFRYGGSYYQESKASYPGSGGMFAFWEQGSEFFDSFPSTTENTCTAATTGNQYCTQSGTPRYLWDETDMPDVGTGASPAGRYWLNVPLGTGDGGNDRHYPGTFSNGFMLKTSGMTNGVLAEDSITGGGSEVVKYISTVYPTGATDSDPPSPIQEFFAASHCFLIDATTTQPQVVNFARVWQRPL